MEAVAHFCHQPAATVIRLVRHLREGAQLSAERGIPTIIGQRTREHGAGQGGENHDLGQWLALRRDGHTGIIPRRLECPRKRTAWRRSSGGFLSCVRWPRENTRNPTPRRYICDPSATRKRRSMPSRRMHLLWRCPLCGLKCSSDLYSWPHPFLAQHNIAPYRGTSIL